AFNFLAGLLGVGCDGIVVKQQVCGLRSDFDNKFAAGTRTVTQTLAQPGDPSPRFCGDNSLYKVTLTYIRTDDQPVRGTDPDSKFLIMSRASGLVLDIPDASSRPGVQIQQFPEKGGGATTRNGSSCPLGAIFGSSSLSRAAWSSTSSTPPTT